MTMGTGVWPFKTPMRHWFCFPCPTPMRLCGWPRQHTYLGPWVVVCPGQLSTSTDLSASLLPSAPTVGFWGCKVLSGRVAATLAGESRPRPRSCAFNLSAMRSSPGGRMSWPRRKPRCPFAKIWLLCPHSFRSEASRCWPCMEQMAHVGCKQIELLTDADPIPFSGNSQRRRTLGFEPDPALGPMPPMHSNGLQIMLRMEAKRGSASLPVWLVDASCWVPDLVQLPDPRSPSHGVWLSQTSNGTHTEVWAGYAKLSLGMLSQLCALTVGKTLASAWQRAAARQPTSPRADGVPFHHIYTQHPLANIHGPGGRCRHVKMGVLDQPTGSACLRTERIQGEVWMAKTTVVDEWAHCQAGLHRAILGGQRQRKNRAECGARCPCQSGRWR